MATIICAFEGARSAISSVRLDNHELVRVGVKDPLVTPHYDAAWAVTDVLVLREVGDVSRWERRLARELVQKLGGWSVEVALEGDLTALPVCEETPSAEPSGVEGGVEWLSGLASSDGVIADEQVKRSLAALHGVDGGLRWTMARACAKPEAAERLEARCRELYGAAPPSDYVRFLQDVGAFRISYFRGEERETAEVLLPVAAVLELLDDHELGEGAGDGRVMPFYRSGRPHSHNSYEYYAFDLSTDPVSVVYLSIDEEQPAYGSFAAWLDALRRASFDVDQMRADADKQALKVSPPSLPTPARVSSWWSKNRGWVREMYADPAEQ